MALDFKATVHPVTFRADSIHFHVAATNAAAAAIRAAEIAAARFNRALTPNDIGVRINGIPERPAIAYVSP